MNEELVINWVNLALLCAGWWMIFRDWHGYRLVGGILVFVSGLCGGAVS